MPYAANFCGCMGHTDQGGIQLASKKTEERYLPDVPVLGLGVLQN